MRSSRWLGGTAALVVTILLFVTSAGFTAMATIEHHSQTTRQTEQGRLHLSKARMATLAATHAMQTDLAAGTGSAAALANFDARRSTINSALSALAEVTPELRRQAGAVSDTLGIVPVVGTSVTVGELQVAMVQVATRVGFVSSQSPLEGELGFGDRLVDDIHRLQLATRLISMSTADPTAEQPYAQLLAIGMTDGSDDRVWRFGQRSISADLPANFQAQLAELTTSENARLVQDAARWASARSGWGPDAEGLTEPDAAAVWAAGSGLSESMLEIGAATLSEQSAELGTQADAAGALALQFIYGVIATGAAAVLMLILRRNRYRIKDDELRAAASTDKLTGLGNRVHLDVEVLLLKERSPEVVLMHIDLDHFKPVNDTYGHAVGDRVLQLSAERLKEAATNHEGVAARLGGDEFVLVLPAMEQQSIDSITKELLRGLQAFQIGGLDLTVGASIGIARGTGEVTDLLINADLALYQAKRTGRGQASTFRAEAAAFVSFVRDALIEGRVQVVYQPQISLRDGRCIGAEVLARLPDRTGTLVPAKEWLGIAEWLGVTGELFEHVVSAVVRDMASGPPLHTKLWFNVAPNDLIRPGGSDWVLQQLGRLQLPVSMIGLELTETEAITDIGRLAVVLERLRTVGLGLALDDFGARNTPIGHLVDLPVTRVKLDASLIAGIGDDMPPSSWVVKAMAELATRLRIDVIAEGVTSGHQVRLLAKLGVPTAQGYLMGLPGSYERIPTGVDIRALLSSSLAGFEPVPSVGPLVQMSGSASPPVAGSRRPTTAPPTSELGEGL